jgi:hypothetical protein
VIRRISSAEDAEIAEKAQKARLWRFAQNAERVLLLVVRPRPVLAAISRRSADAAKFCNDLGTSQTDSQDSDRCHCGEARGRSKVVPLGREIALSLRFSQ